MGIVVGNIWIPLDCLIGRKVILGQFMAFNGDTLELNMKIDKVIIMVKVWTN
jgi:ethanolamine transporter EutH